MLEKNEKKLKNIYFDAHFHWNFANFSKDFCKNLTQNDDFSIYGCSCAHSVEEWNFQIAENLKLQEKSMHKNFCSFGIHPQQVTNESFSAQIDFLQNLISNNKIDAIGEIGFDLGFITNPKNGRVKGLNEVSLDRTYFFSDNFKQFAFQQDELFNIQLEMAIKNQLPIVVHCRKANEKLFEYKKQLKKVPAVLFHSFMGTPIEAKSLIKNDINCFFSFGKQIFNNNKKVIQCVKELPIENLLLETDAPYQFLKNETQTFRDEIINVYKGAFALRAENQNTKEDFDEFCERILQNAKLCFR
ncbi:MAG: TatD family hydrolase [Treponema sp.]|nr:TatD family hydrolase [Treponema sp.]